MSAELARYAFLTSSAKRSRGRSRLGPGPTPYPCSARTDGSISAPYYEGRDHDVIRIFDVATGESRVAVRLPFHVLFRASWVEGGKALVVNRSEPVRHIVLFDRFWGSELENKP